jgi:hypothetical protein
MSLPVISAVNAAMKYLYPKGEPRKAIQSTRELQKRLSKDTGFGGEWAYVPIQHGDAQGIGTSVALAQSAVTETQFKRFQLTRVKHYAVARIDGELMEAAASRGEGSLVDMWKATLDSTLNKSLSHQATMLYGNGSGALGQIASGYNSTTVTLAAGTNMNYFDRLATLGAISTNTYSATVRSGSAQCTGIDRQNRTLTFAAAPNTTIAALVDGDYFVYAGDGSSSGTAKVITGLGKYVDGASTTIFNLDRSEDPSHLSGTVFDATGYAREDALAEATANVGALGCGYPGVAFMHNSDVAALKRSIGSKMTLERSSSSVGKGGYSSVVIEGENGPLEIVTDPFAPIGTVFLLKMDDVDLYSLNGAPHIKKDDGQNYARLAADDAIEARWAFYGNLRMKNPAPMVKITNFGV